jgi:penicillin amidase
MKIIFRSLLALLGLLVVAAIGLYFFMRSSLPDYNREQAIPGLSQPVDVLYDSFAIPHIYAQNEEDLFHALGYVHAQDRLFQMEVLRRLADGRLSEVFGEKALESDKFFRTLSFREHARMTIDSLYQDTTRPFVRAARAYLRGLNEYIRSGKTPVEFTLTGMPKTPFTLEDMEIIVGYMGYTFVGAFKTESVATTIAEKFGPTYLKDVMSNWPDSAYTIPVQAGEMGADTAAARLLSLVATQTGHIDQQSPFPPFLGSNGWVISGRKTKSGRPILSNDTHIGYAQPSVWYEAYLECPGFNVYGNFLAGTPVPALGHSDKGGWGLTMFENDDADFFAEKPNPGNPNQVWYKDHWEDLQVRREMIRVKGKPDVVLDVKKSRHGYILNGAFDEVKDFNVPVALWWVYHQFPSRHLEVFYNISHAGHVRDAARAVEPLTSPGLNFMWADTAGNIAWWAAGKLPVRPAHVNPQRILDGSTGMDDPLGWLPFSQNPQIVNPSRGVLYTANNQPADMGSGLVPGYYVPSNRARRIEALLFTDKSDWTESSVRDVINDVQVPVYPALLRNVLPLVDVRSLSAMARSMYDTLGDWDGRHDLESIAPTMYYKFIYEVYQLAFQDELGTETLRNFENTLSLKRNTASFLQNDSSGWWDNVHTQPKERRSDILAGALNRAAEALSRQWGDDPRQWQWRKVHSIEHKHPLGILPVAGMWFNVGPIPVNGGQETLNNLDFFLDSTGLYPVKSGPALRRIVDFTTPRQAHSVNPTGQSGHFMSPHYDDQAKMFAEGGRRPEHVDRVVMDRIKIARLVLVPGK